jgi:hypothetical protein
MLIMMNFDIPNDIYKEVGCSKSTISRIKQKNRKPSPDLAAKLVKALQRRGINVTFYDLRPDLLEKIFGAND